MHTVQAASYTSLLLGASVQELFPFTQPLKWRTNDRFFIYDFAVASFLGDEVLRLIEEEMHRKKKLRFESKAMVRANAIAFLKDKKRFSQAELIATLPDQVIDLAIAEEAVDVLFSPLGEQDPQQVEFFPSFCKKVEYEELGELLLFRVSGAVFTEKKELKEYRKATREARKFDLVGYAEKEGIISFLHEIPVWKGKGIDRFDAMHRKWRDLCQQLGIEEVISGATAVERHTLEPFDEDPLFPCKQSFDKAHSALLQQKKAPYRIGEISRRETLLPVYESQDLFRTAAFLSDTIHIVCDVAAITEEICRFVEASEAFMKTLGLDVKKKLTLSKQKVYRDAFIRALPDTEPTVSERGSLRVEILVEDAFLRPWMVSFLELDSTLSLAVGKPVLAGSLLYSCERILGLQIQKAHCTEA